MSTHESFLWMDAAIARRFVTSTYKMGARISNVAMEGYYDYLKTETQYSTNYIDPPDVNPDDRFG